MSERYKQTSLWTAHLAARGDDVHEDARERLRQVYVRFREKASMLVEKIQGVLPNLTVHDVTHLDGLWETAETIIGNDYPLNPLETFVFGGAVLLHDSALCFEAYEGGLAEIRSSVEWKDAFATEKRNNTDASDEEHFDSADFAALRQLHARRAGELGEMGWKDPDTNQEIYLIEDANLRKHLGPLIGKIAASHHWSIERVENELPDQVPAIDGFPRDWRIDPVKLACMIRCADAGHVSNDRAPDFLHALTKRSGVSFNHWQAQNWLTRLDTDVADQTAQTGLVRSTRSFGVDDVKSWWVAYDAIDLLQKELRSSNALLTSRPNVEQSPPFKLKAIKGHGSPERMADFIAVHGWEPCSAEIHVSNVESLVANLGGEKLYGDSANQDNFQVAVRELIQNARDAIVARRAMEDGFVGEILVRVRDEEGDIWVDVEDDGSGMSHRVLTQPFLDFGTSFWASDLLKDEFPGLRSSPFRSVGRFGIGFYAVFMIATDVCVTSRNWNKGTDTQNRLVFEGGVSLRPLLQRGPFDDVRNSCSTKVSVRLNERYKGFPSGIEIQRNQSGVSNLNVELPPYLSALVAGLDVDVRLVQGDTDLAIHRMQPFDREHYKGWLTDISYASAHNDQQAKNYIDRNVHRLRPIVENNAQLGLAGLDTDYSNRQNCLSVSTVGGLAHSVHSRGSDYFFGYLEKTARSAKREPGEYVASKETLIAWAEEQRTLIKAASPNPIELYSMCRSLAHFKVDPIDDALAFIWLEQNDQRLCHVTLLVELLKSRDIAIFRMHGHEHADSHVDVRVYENCATLYPVGMGEYYNLELVDGVPANNFSVVDCLHRTALSSGLNPVWTVREKVAPTKFGEPSDVLICSVERPPGSIDLPPALQSTSKPPPRPKPSLSADERKKRRKERKRKEKEKKNQRKKNRK